MSRFLQLISLLFLLQQNVLGGPSNWTYPVAPRQCSNLTITVTGDIFFPLKALIVPIGPSPLNYEVRKVMEVPFGANATSVSFLLPYPTGSKFDGFVVDGTGYTRGPTGITWTVLSSDDASCFDATKDATSLFNFSLSPPDIAECREVKIYWNSSSVQGTPSFIALVPGSGYWDISPGKVVTLPGLGTGYTWRNPVPSTVDLVLVGGDNRGMGSGGFISSTVSPGDTARDSSGNCLSTGATTSNSSSSVNVGAIVGGVIGGVVFLGLLLFILRRLLLFYQTKKLKPRLVDPDMQTQTTAAAAAANRPYYDGSDNTYEPQALYGQPISTPVPRQPSQNHEEPSRLVDVALTPEQPPAYTNQSESTTTPAVTTVPVTTGIKQQRTSWNGPATQTGHEHLTWDGR